MCSLDFAPLCLSVSSSMGLSGIGVHMVKAEGVWLVGHNVVNNGHFARCQIRDEHRCNYFGPVFGDLISRNKKQ